jgi:hypothetical protein
LLQGKSFRSTKLKALRSLVLKNNSFVFTNILYKDLTSLRSISIVNRGHLLLPSFRIPTHKKKKRGRENTKKNKKLLIESKKNILVRGVYKNA